jgi:hypothetical protein
MATGAATLLGPHPGSPYFASAAEGGFPEFAIPDAATSYLSSDVVAEEHRECDRRGYVSYRQYVLDPVPPVTDPLDPVDLHPFSFSGGLGGVRVLGPDETKPTCPRCKTDMAFLGRVPRDMQATDRAVLYRETADSANFRTFQIYMWRRSRLALHDSSCLMLVSCYVMQ